VTLRPLLSVSALLLLGACTAVRGTVKLAQAEQAVLLARQAGAPERAVYAFTRAEAFMVKAREEWGYADYGAAEALCSEATTWADKARQEAEVAPAPPAAAAPPDAAAPPAAAAPAGVAR
jgi:hypothetical protein